MKKYIISEKNLRRLLESEMRLDILEADGVDNWIWYMEGAAEYIQNIAGNKEDCDFEDAVDIIIEDYEILEG